MDYNKYIKITAGLTAIVAGYFALAFVVAKFINLVNYFM